MPTSEKDGNAQGEQKNVAEYNKRNLSHTVQKLREEPRAVSNAARTRTFFFHRFGRALITNCHVFYITAILHVL